MLKKPKVSVVVPTFNSGKFLLKCIQSLLRQDFPGPYEIIIVDDGSTDGSVDLIDGNDKKIRILRQKNFGAGIARYRGVQEARGDIIVFQDSDDIALPHKLSILVDALNKFPECIMSCALTSRVSNYQFSSVSSSSSSIEDYDIEIEDYDIEIIKDPLLELFGQSYPIASAMNLATYREIALEVGPVDPKYRVANDYAFQIRLASRGSFVRICSVTTIYNERSNSLSCTYGFFLQMASALLASLEIYNQLTSKSKYSRIFIQRFEKDFPMVFPFLIKNRSWSMTFILAKYAFFYCNLWNIFRRTWWTLDQYESELEIPSFFRFFISSLRKIRNISKNMFIS